jgi:hypothetical protein
MSFSVAVEEFQMSGPPVRPRSRELEIVRVLFDKHLLERAVNLAEARWAGSGAMVRLAYHWQDLGPAERRQQLEAIGPEQLAHFRALADLDPELASVLDTLEQRGVIPPLPSTADDAGQPADDVEPPPIYDDPPVISGREARAHFPPGSGGVTGDLPDEVTIDASPIARSDDQGGSGFASNLRSGSVTSLSEAVPELDLSSADLESYARAEQERRAEAVRTGEELLQRVRDRLSSSARRVTANPIGSGSSAPILPKHVPDRMAGQASASAVTLAEDAAFVPPPDYWVNRLQAEPVVVADGSILLPTDDQLVALANELSLELAEFVIEAGTSRALFGGLKRRGHNVDVVVGPIPSALAHPALVVLRGRLFPRMEERLRGGMCDIPGTRASVRVHPETRVLILPRDS